MFVSFLESENIYKCLFQFESCLQISWISITSIFRKNNPRIFMAGNQLDDDFPNIYEWKTGWRSPFPSIHLPNCLAVGFQGNHTQRAWSPQPHPTSPSQRPGSHRNTTLFFGGGGCYSPLRSPKKRDDFNRKIVFQPAFLGDMLVFVWEYTFGILIHVCFFCGKFGRKGVARDVGWTSTSELGSFSGRFPCGCEGLGDTKVE